MIVGRRRTAEKILLSGRGSGLGSVTVSFQFTVENFRLPHTDSRQSASVSDAESDVDYTKASNSSQFT